MPLSSQIPKFVLALSKWSVFFKIVYMPNESSSIDVTDASEKNMANYDASPETNG